MSVCLGYKHSHNQFETGGGGAQIGLCARLALVSQWGQSHLCVCVCVTSSIPSTYTQFNAHTGSVPVHILCVLPAFHL